MSHRPSHTVFLLALTLVFTAGLTFASLELPYLVDEGLMSVIRTPGFDSEVDQVSQFKTELFINHYSLRLIGYVCFALTVALIIIGYAAKRSGLAALGAVALMLPVFAQFAGVMFFLSGLGIFNLLWLPVLDVSFDIQNLGLIIRAPYDLIMWTFRQVGLSVYWPLVYACIGGGLLIFLVGTYTWLRARTGPDPVARGWIYRYSRHPQYLGWILWTYGLYLLLLLARYPKRSWGIDASLSWLLSTMVIVGVAMIEEISMQKRFGDSYEQYRRSAPFLFPVPSFISKISALPSKLLFRKERPEKPREVILLITVTTFVLIGASYAFYGQGSEVLKRSFTPNETRQEQMQEIVRQINETESGRQRYFLTDRLADYGPSALEYFIRLLKSPVPGIRNEAIRHMHRFATPEAVSPLCEALHDSLPDVRSGAAGALAVSGVPEVVDSISGLLHDPVPWVRLSAMHSLAALGVKGISHYALQELDSANVYHRIGCLSFLATVKDSASAPGIEKYLEDENVNVRRAAVVALASIRAQRSRGALARAARDDDWEVSIYAAEALRMLDRNLNVEE